jgi:hypothetical protein
MVVGWIVANLVSISIVGLIASMGVFTIMVGCWHSRQQGQPSIYARASTDDWSAEINGVDGKDFI